MQKFITKKLKGISLVCSLFTLLLLLAVNLRAQTVSTVGGTGYTGNIAVNNALPLIASFVIENTGATPLALTSVSSQMGPGFGGAVAGNVSANKLYMSTTSLGGNFDVSTAAWSQVATGTSTVPAAVTIVQCITGASIVIPAGAQYRFVLELSRGLVGSTNLVPGEPLPTPSSFTSGNVVLKLGDVVLPGGNVGYIGVTPAPVAGNTPFWFGGSVTLVSSVPCAGTPAPGNTITSAPSVCPATPFTLSLQNFTSGSGVTYQWQSATALAGPYTNIAGATNASLTVPNLTASTFYQAIVTCSGASTTSTPVQVMLTPPSGCYCIPPASDCTDGDIITNVTFGTLNNTSTCGTAGYTVYAPGPGINIPDVVVGGGNPITISAGDGTFTESVGVWIDYNRNGIFDTNEFTLIGTQANPTVRTGTINVPAGVAAGQTRMRVRVRFNTALVGTAACLGYAFGETEDYTVNLIPCVPTTFTTQTTNQSVSCGNTATFTVAVAGSLPVYQWQYRVNATAAWLNVPNAAPYTGVNTNSLVISPADASLNNYQYRALVTGACAAANPSNAATLTVTALALAVSPGSISKCVTGAPVLISAPNTQTILNFTNNTPGAVADGDLVGISRDVTVSGVTGPVQKVRVRINATSNYIGDLVISLKAPNGQIINLDYLLNKTNNGPGTSPTLGFVNTFFNLYRTVQNNPATNVPAAQAINNFTDPYTAEFPIDNQQALFFVGVPSGPTGFAATTTNPASLTPTPASANGVWTLAMYDAGPPDPATFQNFTLEITYGGAPATITLSPTTGLFTDAAGTIPYTGNAVTQVYANPAVSTTYSTTITAGTCSVVQSIPVTVSAPATAVAAVASKSVCPGGTTTFTSSVTGGATVVKVWQVSTDGGNTYTPLTNGGVYSGVSTDVLTITGATIAMNNYLYRLSTTAAPCAGSVNSTPGTLTVFPTPVVVISASPYTAVYPGLTTTLTAAVSSGVAATYAWTYNGAPLAGATGNTVTNLGVNNTGTYSVAVTTTNGCAATSNTITIRDSANTNLFIYPNPNNGSFQVRYFNTPDNPFAGTPRSVVVYDSKGSRVYSQATIITPGTYGAMNINLVNQPAGIYHVDLVDGRGNRLQSGKVVIL